MCSHLSKKDADGACHLHIQGTWRTLGETMGPIKSKPYASDFTHTLSLSPPTLSDDEINVSDESELQESL